MFAAASVLLLGLATPVAAVSEKSGQQAVEVQPRGKIVQRHSQLQPEGDDDIDFVGSSYAEISSSRRQLVRSEDVAEPLSATPGVFQPSQILQGAVADGVAQGACKNFKKTGLELVAASCPEPLKMVGCSCRDKEGENSGGCGTKFSERETCSAFTKKGANITAYVRCCHIDWATDFQIKTSKVSGAKDGDGVRIGCEEEQSLLGCACLPTDSSNSCKHTRVEEDKCFATTLKGKGVKAQALCAVMPNSSSWESVSVKDHAKNVPATLECGHEKQQMLSCSCGSSYGQCNGGKVVANRCECFGARCFATARCAKVPVPPRDCIWNVWSEWSDCSATCGMGQKDRIREIAMLEANGGQACTGKATEIVACKAEGNVLECNRANSTKSTKSEKAVVPSGGHSTLWIILSVVGVFAALAAIWYYYHSRPDEAARVMGSLAAWCPCCPCSRRYLQERDMLDKMVGEYGGDWGEHSGQEGEWAGESQWPGQEAAGQWPAQEASGEAASASGAQH